MKFEKDLLSLITVVCVTHNLRGSDTENRHQDSCAIVLQCILQKHETDWFNLQAKQ